MWLNLDLRTSLNFIVIYCNKHAIFFMCCDKLVTLHCTNYSSPIPKCERIYPNVQISFWIILQMEERRAHKFWYTSLICFIMEHFLWSFHLPLTHTPRAFINNNGTSRTLRVPTRSFQTRNICLQCCQSLPLLLHLREQRSYAKLAQALY